MPSGAPHFSSSSFLEPMTVDDVFEEVAHAAFPDGLGHPIDGAVGGNELVLHLGDLDEPARTRIVHEGGIAPPAVGIVVLEGQRLEELAALFEHLQNDGVCLLDEEAVKFGAALVELALFVDEGDDGERINFADVVVVLTERGRDVDDARAVRQRDVGIADDFIHALPLVLHGFERGFFSTTSYSSKKEGTSASAKI